MMGTLTHAVYPNIEVTTTFFDKVALACAHGAHYSVKFDGCKEMKRSPDSIDNDSPGRTPSPNPKTVRDALSSER
jgi:hypothetical protein